MIYKNRKTQNISFPLGGIGAGCIGLLGNGELRDFEIFNHPDKCMRNGYSHFAIKASYGGKSIAKVLHGDSLESLTGTPGAGRNAPGQGYGYGPLDNSFAGFPHFKDVTFDGTFPTANITFADSDFPAVVRLCAFNPFIPHDEYNSSLPAAFFEWEIENITSEDIQFTVACTVGNPAASTLNEKISDGKLNGIMLKAANVEDNVKEYSDLCILTDGDDATVQEYWYRGNLIMDSVTTYWKNFANLERLPERHYDNPSESRKDHGTVASYINIPAKGKAKVRFIISWNVPVAYNYWVPREEEGAVNTWRNYYATQFVNSFATAKYALENFDSLRDKTVMFADALQSCTLSESVKDAISANLSVLKSPTVLRIEDGSFWAWEGCSATEGSCFGTCQHVWNYAYAMPYLFPRLERSIREITLKYALQDSGATSFRVNLPLKKEMWFRPCVDGQMGEVIKCYREWKLSGDNEWLEQYSESIFKMLEYAWSPENPDKWDANMDGVIEGRQHHTLDKELFGPNSWLQGFYLLALDCGAKMAKHLGDEKRVSLYTHLYDSGKAWMNEHLFNGKYFCQKIDLTDKSIVENFDAAGEYWNDEAKQIRYQVADGSIIDQMLADWHAILLGADCVFDPEKKKIALENMYRNNFKSSMREITNMWRIFSLNDEAGTVMCAYPEGCEIPAIPITYCEETMTGFEYALAGLMIAEGYITEGETMIKAIRDRYDGEKRNPWNEIECGSNYARSMASYALMPIYSGFTFDMTRKHIGFAPIKRDKGKYVFSVSESWGMVEFDGDGYRISMLGNPLALSSVSVPNCEKVTKVTVDGKAVDFEIADGKLILGDVEIHKELQLA